MASSQTPFKKLHPPWILQKSPQKSPIPKKNFFFPAAFKTFGEKKIPRENSLKKKRVCKTPKISQKKGGVPPLTLRGEKEKKPPPPTKKKNTPLLSPPSG
ncbi:hypothetical protein EBI_26527 [Enterocytozoon bieneusi H348]|nr:hypothetical protein EBI_26527 [Enterocytozoon bieneusi H348]|eukprot:XP_002651089.1 hypothetical protein EBI_26527 [Enterocytozoon bieneusi H348]